MKKCICILFLILSFLFCSAFVNPSSTNIYQGVLVGSGVLNGLSCSYYLSDYSGIAQYSDGTLFNSGSEKLGGLLVGGVELPFRFLSSSSSLLVPQGDSTILYNLVVDVVPTTHSVDVALLAFISVCILLLIFFVVIGRGVIL